MQTGADTLDFEPLADPIVNSLAGRQRRFAEARGRVARYQPDVSVFYGHPKVLADKDWADLTDLAHGGTASIRDRTQPLPDGWHVRETFELVQYSGEALDTVTPDEAPKVVELGTADIAEMTALVRLTHPGPFLPRTIELGTYLGIRDDDGSLIAMAGERMKPAGWTEISAVCTAPHARGRGLATLLIRAVGAGIRARGEHPFLHTTADNPARGLYESLGFVLRSEVPLDVVRVADA